MSASWARIIVFVSTSALLAALQVQPRSVPVLVLSAVGLLIGLWSYTRGQPGAVRLWMTLIVGCIGGLVGFVTWLDVMNASTTTQDAGQMIAAGATRGGASAAVTGLVLGLAWPSWWWRWGLMLSWGFVVTALADTETLHRIALLPFIPLPFVAAKAGAVVRQQLLPHTAFPDT